MNILSLYENYFLKSTLLSLVGQDNDMVSWDSNLHTRRMHEKRECFMNMSWDW